MKTQLDCFPCYMRQALQAARLATTNHTDHWRVMRAMSAFISEIDPSINCMVVAEAAHQVIRDALRDPDPYLAVKEQYSALCEQLEPEIASVVASTPGDPLYTAIKVAIAGNIIDFGASESFDLNRNISAIIDEPFSIDHFTAFRSAISSACNIVYLGDNTGEIYFDKPLLSMLCEDHKITFITRGGPIINDVTPEYALRAGIDRFATITDSGIPSPGFPLDRVSPHARRLFDEADIVISKGQGNIEALHDCKRPNLFFLMKVKCELIAKMLGAPFNSMILAESASLDFDESVVNSFVPGQ